MIIYGLKNCDTCRKALKSLSDAELIDIRQTPMPDLLLERAFAQFGDDLVNRRSTTWRNLDENQRLRPGRELLAEHPPLMKRPLIEHNGELFLGWTADTRAALGAS